MRQRCSAHIAVAYWDGVRLRLFTDWLGGIVRLSKWYKLRVVDVFLATANRPSEGR